jgi:hypothetical protein
MTSRQSYVLFGLAAALFVAVWASSQSRPLWIFRWAVLRIAVSDAYLRVRFVFNPQMRTVARYFAAVTGLDVAVGMREVFDRCYIAKSSPEEAARARESRAYAEIRRYNARKFVRCIAYFASMSDTDAHIIAQRFCGEHLKNRVPAERFAEFLRSERRFILASSYRAIGHTERAGNFVLLSLAQMQDADGK